MPLNVEPNIASPDEFYEALLASHRDLTRAESEALNARIILLLANHIGDMAVLREALEKARNSGGEPVPESSDRNPNVPKRQP